MNLRQWWSDRKAARLAAYRKRLANLRAMYPNEPLAIVEGLLSDNVHVAAAASRVIAEAEKRRQLLSEIRQVVREELGR